MEEPKEQDQNQNPEPNLQNNEEPNIDLDLDVEPEQVQPQNQVEAPQEEPSAPEPPQAEPQSEEPQVVTTASEAVVLDIKPDKKFRPSKKMMLFGLVGILLVVVVAVAGWMFLKKDNDETAKNTQLDNIVLMGAELTIVDGQVQKSTDNKTWQDVKIGEQVAEGNYIKTLQNGRAVIALDDGSAIRINNNSIVKINSLDTTNVVITNSSGEIYTRLVKSDRQFSVKVAEENYISMGTAYKTVNTAEVKGVEVYESKVKLSKANIEVPEGKYFYDASKDAAQIKKLSDIPIDKVKQDAFMAWNYEQDKNSSEFKDELGYLDKAYTATTPTPTTPKVTTTGISLTGTKYSTGVKLTWSLSNVSAPKGFKIVKSLAPDPTYGKDNYQYVSDPNARSYSWTIKDGKTYHFRVCVYTGSGCSVYSNNVIVTAPYVASSEPSGSLYLTHNGGQNFSWAFNGSAPNGFKLVWSTSSGPTYPNTGNPVSDNQYYPNSSTRSGSIRPTSGTYYVRVCLLGSNGCASTNYSTNELKVTY